MSGPPDEPPDSPEPDDSEPAAGSDEPTLLDQGDRTALEPTVAQQHHLVDEEAISRFAGFLSMPVHRRFPLRRSTVLMAVAFVGFGIVLYFNPPQSTPTYGRYTAPNGQQYDVVPVPSTTTTTTTVPATTTTAPGPGATTTSPTAPVSSSTTTSTPPPGHSSTTTTRSSTTTTSTTTAASSSTSTTTTGVGVSSSSTPTTSGSGR